MSQETLFKVVSMIFEVGIALLLPAALKLLLKGHEALKVKMGKESLTWAEEQAGVIVESVEQMYPALKGAGKYKIALELLNKWTGQKFSDDKLQLLIEASVRSINYGKPPKEIEIK